MLLNDVLKSIIDNPNIPNNEVIFQDVNSDGDAKGFLVMMPDDKEGLHSLVEHFKQLGIPWTVEYGIAR